ncbi:FAST kinase domain-containing protein 2, mitochondrial [Ambystoma mexicanum]|uniref:FAST kinase domain-containing protein 2, mitochondrial n=1 Tax=Ambystoma mexicanum TaxID=8296 RepID=UPI0037E86EDA
MTSGATRSLIRAVGQVQKGGLSLGGRVPDINGNLSAPGIKRQLHTFNNVKSLTQLLSPLIHKPSSSFRFLYRETPDSDVQDGTERGTSVKDELDDQLCIPPGASFDSEKTNLYHPRRRQRRGFTDSWEDSRSLSEASDHHGVKENLQWHDFNGALQKCTSPSDVLDLTATYSLTWKQNSTCLTTMWDSIKKMSEEKKWHERKLMFEHPAFIHLCLRVTQEASRMNSSDLAYSTLALLKLKVSQRARVIETLLRHCQERLNEFDERALCVLASSLEGLEDSKNVEALRSGLRLRVEQQIPSIKGTLALQTIMRYIGKDASLSLKKKLESKALELFDRFSLPNCQHMYTTLAFMNFHSLPLLDACSNRIIGNINGIPFWRFVDILHSCKDLQYQNVELFSAIGDYVAGSMYMWQTKQVVLFLSLFENLGFRHEDLMDTFAEKVMAKPESLILKDLVITLRVYSMLNHFPGGQNPRFLEALNSSLEAYLPRIPSIELLRAVYSSCIMGYFPQAALSKLLQEDTLNELLNSANQNITMNERMLHYINLCLELDKPSVTKVATDVVLGRPSTGIVRNPTSLLLALQEILGEGDECFRQNLQLPNDYFFDFELCMDKDRRTVIPLTEIEELNNTTDIQRVALIYAPIFNYCLGTSHPRGKLAMKMRHLRAMGYHVVLIHEQEFEKMKMDDRIVFLKSQIFSPDAIHNPCLKSTEEQLEI